MKKLISLICIVLSVCCFSQSKKNNASPKKTKSAGTNNSAAKSGADPVVANNSLPSLIPKKRDGKFGYVNQNSKFVILPQFHNAAFFNEDCSILNSVNIKVRPFGTADFATVEINSTAYRINKSGKKVYEYKNSDLGKCQIEYLPHKFYAYKLNGLYGVIEKGKFENPADYRSYTIYPQYQYLSVMEGDDASNPMIVASVKDKFGVIDIHNRIIIPFEYNDIKRNYSWKLGKMFEVTKDDKNFYYIDTHNKAY